VKHTKGTFHLMKVYYLKKYPCK